MLTLAVLLLPGLSLLLVVMSRIEDTLQREPHPARHARPRHLRLLPGGKATGNDATEPEEHSAAA
ncbi:hypothetical protein [Streptomyces chromofuscus]|uniref:Uncharacterized protein n=1 Tax=Streptomyces chromofuscus TaxID=42881 RepID=A0A7M2T842_STRCW|nr:hypothetical protein [Streptomyces chromofuscus]QOV44867.1 hypothetical protein IPT68_02315 [Streptomyces chromofuscus]GGT33783.1 hypothetical protein GCM10010254_62870 [Streptomyces chromofuscus]